MAIANGLRLLTSLTNRARRGLKGLARLPLLEVLLDIHIFPMGLIVSTRLGCGKTISTTSCSNLKLTEDIVIS